MRTSGWLEAHSTLLRRTKLKEVGEFGNRGRERCPPRLGREEPLLEDLEPEALRSAGLSAPPHPSAAATFAAEASAGAPGGRPLRLPAPGAPVLSTDQAARIAPRSMKASVSAIDTIPAWLPRPVAFSAEQAWASRTAPSGPRPLRSPAA